MTACLLAEDLASDANGHVYLAELRKVRKIDASTGVITTYAGTGANGSSGDGGPATAAGFAFLTSVAVDRSGNVFVADANAHRVRRIDVASGRISTVAGSGSFLDSGDGGPATAAGLCGPHGVESDATGNLFIVNDCFYGDSAGTSNDMWWTNRIRRVDAGTGAITSFAGAGPVGYAGDAGPAVAARFGWRIALAMDQLGNLFVADSDNHRVRQISGNGVITTVAGSGVGDGRSATSAQLARPIGLAIGQDNSLFILDGSFTRIRKVDAMSEIITTVAGGDVPGCYGDGIIGTRVALVPGWGWALQGDLALNATGQLLFSDVCGSIRRLDSSGIVHTVMANGWRSWTSGVGHGLAVNSAGELLATNWEDNTVQRFATDGTASVVAGSGAACALATAPCGDGGPAIAAQLGRPADVEVDPAGNVIIADQLNNRVRKIDSASNAISTIAGTGVRCLYGVGVCGDGGPATAAALSQPYRLVFDRAGNLFVGGESRVRRVHGRTGAISTVAGTTSGSLTCGVGGAATTSCFGNIIGMALDEAGNLFVSTGHEYLATTPEYTRVYGIRHPGNQFIVPAIQPGGMVKEGQFLRIVDQAVGGAVLTVDMDTDVMTGRFETAPLGITRPAGITHDGAGHLFVSDGGGVPGRVYEIDRMGTTVINTFEVAFRPGALAFDGSQLFVSDRDSGIVTVTDRGGAVVRTFDARRRAADLEFDTSTGRLWVIDKATTLLSELRADGSVSAYCPGPREPDPSGGGGLALTDIGLYVAEVSDRDSNSPPNLRAIVHVIDRASMQCQSPDGAVDALVDLLENMPLTTGVATSLSAILSRAEALLSDADTTNDGQSCPHLQAYANEVSQREQNGGLTATQAALLKAAVQQLQQGLGC